MNYIDYLSLLHFDDFIVTFGSDFLAVPMPHSFQLHLDNIVKVVMKLFLNKSNSVQ